MNFTKKRRFENLKIQNDECNREKLKFFFFSSGSMDLRISTWEILRSLITNPSSKFKNSKWQIQYGGERCEKLLDLDDIRYLGDFGVLDYESEPRI